MCNGGKNPRGFSLIELLLTMALAATLMAIAVPVLNSVTDATKLGESAQQLEREFQTARLKAVANNSPLRVRTNCPATGYFRIVELLGTSSDTPLSRCNASSYPWPAADTDLSTLPNFDGPVRQLLNSATMSTVSLEFRPDGTAWDVSSGTATTITTPVSITVTRNSKTRSITVNNLGKILLQ
jgi:prepilin-type N-terminal cleavage/methylation domain-containing protein